MTYPTIHSFSYNDVFRYVDQLEVWSWVLNSRVSVGEKFASPFRHDNKPGCFLRDYNGLILFTDFAMPEYNKFTCVHAVSHMMNVSLNDASTIICNKFMSNIDNSITSTKDKHDKVVKRKSEITFMPFTYKGNPAFTPTDRDYWKPRGITTDDLKAKYVYSVHHFHVNGKLVKPVYPCYAFMFPDSGNVKIYQPNNKDIKWISSTNSNDVWMWTNYPIPEKAIITKSFKDGMMLSKIMTGYDIYAFQSEAVIPETTIQMINMLLYDDVIILYDNDATGISYASVLEDMLDNGRAMFYPKEYGKDTDDVFFKKGKDFIYNYLTN